MVRFDVARTGLVFGALLGGLHALWAGVVASGWGQWLLDLIFRLHFIDPPYQVAAFEEGPTAVLTSIYFANKAALGECMAKAGTPEIMGDSARSKPPSVFLADRLVLQSPTVCAGREKPTRFC